MQMGQKKTKDYDSVFKTMKLKHKRFFIAVINDVFGKSYPMDAPIETVPAENYFTEGETANDSMKAEERITDFVMKIGQDVYLLECQSYDDGSMAIRIAEYAFLVARQFAIWDIGHATIPMPHVSVIYIKKTEHTPRTTSYTFTFPNGECVTYESDNVFLTDLTKEYMIEKRMFAYIPFYIARYEKALISTEGEEQDLEQAVTDLEYFRNEIVRIHREGELTDYEFVDLKRFVNTIIEHITNGNQNEKRMVEIMGGTILETESERLLREGREQGSAREIIEIGQEIGWDKSEILERIQEKAGVTLDKAKEYFVKYAKV
jgi:hypothetical protein